MRILLLLSLCFLVQAPLFGQQLVFPDAPNWTQVDEGKPLTFQLTVNDESRPARFSLEGGFEFGIDRKSVV